MLGLNFSDVREGGKMISKIDRVRGGLVGLLVGDALGVPYECHPPAEIPASDQIDFSPPDRFVRSHRYIRPGTWSDDGAQALCLLASLLDRGKLDLQDFAEKLVDWYKSGYMAVDGNVFDIGTTTWKALRAVGSGTPAETAGLTDVQSNGNGSLMRVLPLALWHRGTDVQLVNDAQRQSVVTHGHMRSRICCAVYCLLARRIMEECPHPWGDAVDTLKSICKDDADAMSELECHVCPDEPIEPTGHGYVVDSLRAAQKALSIATYEEAVRWSVSLGHDTDTTACVVGGIIGLRDGIAGISEHWITRLRGTKIYSPLLENLVSAIR